MKTLTLVTAIILMGVCSGNAQTTKPTEHYRLKLDLPEAKLKKSMRHLLQQHVTDSRAVIISVLYDLDGTNEAVALVLNNQQQLCSALKPYYGDDKAKQLGTLLNEHTRIGVELLTTAKKGNADDIAAVNKKWQDNADAITAFLGTINPNWKNDRVKTAMDDLLQATAVQSKERDIRDHQGDMEDYLNLLTKSLNFSDMLTDGIIKQFPQKFQRSVTLSSVN